MGFNRFWFLNFKSFNHVEQVYFIESKLIHFPFTVSPYIFNRDLNHCLLGSSAFRWASGSEVKITICIFGKLQQSVSGEFVFFYIFLKWFRLYMDIQFIVSWRIVRIDDLFRFDPKKVFPKFRIWTLELLSKVNWLTVRSVIYNVLYKDNRFSFVFQMTW